MKYGEPRYTKDLDLWVHNSARNSARIVEALRKFGAPLDHDQITPGTFSGKQVRMRPVNWLKKDTKRTQS